MEDESKKIIKTIFASKNIRRLTKAPFIPSLFKLIKHPIKLLEVILRHYLFGVRLTIGWLIWFLGVIFFIFNTIEVVYFIIEEIYIEGVFIKFPFQWHVKLLQFIDRFFIFATIVFIGERITVSTYAETQKYRISPSFKPSFTIEFDKTLASMVVITISISFLSIVLQEGLLQVSKDIMRIGAGMGFIIIAIGLWSYLNYKKNDT